MLLTFNQERGGVFKIFDGRDYVGALSRSGFEYRFIPEPFVILDMAQLSQILEYGKGLIANANAT